MNWLFDTSSLLLLIRSPHYEQKLKLLGEGSITPLTFYEIGNAVWTESELLESLSKDDLGTLQEKITRILPTIWMFAIPFDDFAGILEIAKNERLSFYDSSFVHLARKRNLTLVTDDAKLSRIAKKYIVSKSIHELI